MDIEYKYIEQLINLYKESWKEKVSIMMGDSLIEKFSKEIDEDFKDKLLKNSIIKIY